MNLQMMPDPILDLASVAALEFQMSFPPTFDHLKSSVVIDHDAVRHGISIFRDCVIVNPDGTGFGNGMLEVEILRPRAGDRLYLTETDELSVRGHQVAFDDKVVARTTGDDVLPCCMHLIRLRFAPDVYYRPLAALVSAIRFQNDNPDLGERKVAIRVTDADNETGIAEVTLDIEQTPKTETVSVKSFSRQDLSDGFGALYVATSGFWLREALRSHLSLRYYNSAIRTAIVIGEGLRGTALSDFDYVIVTKTGEYHGYTDKVRALSLTPFETTLFLDSDTHVRGNIEHLAERLGEFPIAVSDAPWSKHATSTGVILYQRNRAASILREWIKRMCLTDQAALGYFEKTRTSYGDMDIFNRIIDERGIREQICLLPSRIYNNAGDQLWTAVDNGTVRDSLILHTHSWDRLNQLAPVPELLGRQISQLQEFIDAVQAEVQQLIAAGDRDRALVRLLNAINYFPFVHLLISAAQLFWSDGDLQDAETYFRRALAVEPKGAYCYGRYADFLLSTGRREEATDAAQKAVAFDPVHKLVDSVAALLSGH